MAVSFLQFICQLRSSISYQKFDMHIVFNKEPPYKELEAEI